MNGSTTTVVFAAVSILAAAFVIGACHDPAQDYDDFLARADRSAPELTDLTVEGVLVDITGEFLFNIDLKPLGEVQLGLRCNFTSWELNADSDQATVIGEFRFADETLEDEPVTTFTTTMNSDGEMTIPVTRVYIAPERSPVQDTAVETEFDMAVIVLDENNLCGQIDDDESMVFAPVELILRGTTFGARRFGDDGAIPVDVPTECPFVDDGGDDMGVDTGDVGDVGGDTGDELLPPDVDLGPGVRADVTGRFWMKVALAGTALGLDFVVDINYHEGPEAASIDGTLRSAIRDPGETAIESFSAAVDEDGGFVIIIPQLEAPSDLGDVVAAVALRGVIQDADTMCGEAAGAVESPLSLALDGTTFGMVRISDDSREEPENALAACR